MAKNFEVFFSNHLEVLYQNLKISLFRLTTPFRRRLVVVYGPAMKNWLMLRMAQDPDLKIAMGIECISLNQAFEHLLKLVCDNHVHLPSQLELTLAIETELREIIQKFHTLTKEEQTDWNPFIHYLQINVNSHFFISRKMEKRLISLSQHLASLFQDYGRYASSMVTKWDSHSFGGWQPCLWRKIFGKKFGWAYLIKALKNGKIEINEEQPLSLYFFSISFLTGSEFSFLDHLSQFLPVHYYLLSPCAVFWSDIRSDRENAYLQSYWQNKLGALSPKVIQLEEFLRDRNPLLANFGRIGREMACQIEESHLQTHAHYTLSQQVKVLNPDFCLDDELFLSDTKKSLSLLQALQADLLLMRNPQGLPPYDFENEKRSIQLHIAPNRRREVEILYHNFIGLFSEDRSLSQNDVIVMAPEIGDYYPYIQAIFGMQGSLFDFQILDLGMQRESELVQGFLQLIDLSENRWEANKILHLFRHPFFQRRHSFSAAEYATVGEWIEGTGICWGIDPSHRSEVLERHHCQKKMVDESEVGTWEYGISRLLYGLLYAEETHSSEILPYKNIEFSQGDLLGKWIHLLHSLRHDLSPLRDEAKMTMNDWMNYFICLLESYFQPNFDDPQSIKEYDDFKHQLEILRHSARSIEKDLFSYTSVKLHLLSLLQYPMMTYQEDRIPSIRFCSLMPLRTIPAKIIAILGLEAGSFPRISHASSLNIMKSEDGDFCPQPRDFDRYLFLEALHSAQEILLLSYSSNGGDKNKELQCSIIVDELFSYLDKYYTIDQKKISQACFFFHPLDSFDQKYFTKEKCLFNFSYQDYLAAQLLNNTKKIVPHSFITQFHLTRHHQNAHFTPISIDLKHFTALVRNPIKFYLNKVLEIYLENEEDRKIKVEEELILSPLKKYCLKQLAIKEPLEKVLHQAEKEGILPFGLFKTVAMKQLKEEVEETHENLARQGIHDTPLFHMEFCSSCSHPTQLEKDRWLFPPILLSLEDQLSVSITGKLPLVSQKGLLIPSKGTLSDVWKVWPHFLLYCYAVQHLPQNFASQLIFLQTGKVKKAFFQHSEFYLRQFIHYYLSSFHNISPLLPDWIPFILEKNHLGLQDKMQKLFSDYYLSYQNEELCWALNKNHLPDPEKLIQEWHPEAEKLVGDIKYFWFREEV